MVGVTISLYVFHICFERGSGFSDILELLLVILAVVSLILLSLFLMLVAKVANTEVFGKQPVMITIRPSTANR
jgi:hypothetical protein